MVFVIPETVEGWRSAGIPIIGSNVESILTNKLYVLHGIMTIGEIVQDMFYSSFCQVQIRVWHYDGERIGQLSLRNSRGNGDCAKLLGHLLKLHESALSLEGRVGVHKYSTLSLIVGYISIPGLEAVVKGGTVKHINIHPACASYADLTAV